VAFEKRSFARSQVQVPHADESLVEPEGTHPRKVVIELGVEELFLRRRATQLERAIEAALHEGQSQAVERPVARVGRVHLMRGAELLERGLVKRKPGYADYIARTSAFVPMPPRMPRA